MLSHKTVKRCNNGSVMTSGPSRLRQVSGLCSTRRVSLVIYENPSSFERHEKVKNMSCPVVIVS